MPFPSGLVAQTSPLGPTCSTLTESWKPRHVPTSQRHCSTPPFSSLFHRTDQHVETVHCLEPGALSVPVLQSDKVRRRGPLGQPRADIESLLRTNVFSIHNQSQPEEDAVRNTRHARQCTACSSPGYSRTPLPTLSQRTFSDCPAATTPFHPSPARIHLHPNQPLSSQARPSPSTSSQRGRILVVAGWASRGMKSDDFTRALCTEDS